MTTRPLSSASRQPIVRKTSLLGLLFFLLGAPNLYVFFNRQHAVAASRSARYGWIAAIALVMAGAIELSLIG